MFFDLAGAIAANGTANGGLTLSSPSTVRL
jgi:hypothetical protein